MLPLQRTLKSAKKEKPIFQAHEIFLLTFFPPKDFFSTLFHYENLKDINPNPSHTLFCGSGRNMLCSAKRKINVATTEIKRYLYFGNVYIFICLISRHALNFYQ